MICLFISYLYSKIKECINLKIRVKLFRTKIWQAFLVSRRLNLKRLYGTGGKEQEYATLCRDKIIKFYKSCYAIGRGRCGTLDPICSVNVCAQSTDT